MIFANCDRAIKIALSTKKQDFLVKLTASVGVVNHYRVTDRSSDKITENNLMRSYNLSTVEVSKRDASIIELAPWDSIIVDFHCNCTQQNCFCGESELKVQSSTSKSHDCVQRCALKIRWFSKIDS